MSQYSVGRTKHFHTIVCNVQSVQVVYCRWELLIIRICMLLTSKWLTGALTLFIVVTTSINAMASQNDFSIKSSILSETRNIKVHLPADYDSKPDDKFAVIYMLDAGNDDQLAAQTALKLAEDDLMPPVIIIAIENIRRGFDFTPGYLKMGRGDNRKAGNGDKFLDFITDELMPNVDKTLHTNGKQYFMGHSWGGAFSSYVLSQRPELFSGFFIFSPSFINIPNAKDMQDKLSIDFVKNISKAQTPSFIYLSVGTKERQGFINSYNGFKSFLNNNLPKNRRLFTQETQGADHMVNPELSIPKAFRLAFSKGS